MTLILAAKLPNQFLIFSDMRLSWNGEIKTDDSVKAGCFVTEEVSTLFVYTGLAYWQPADFVTMPWLTGALYDCDDGSVVGSIYRFRDVATKKFDELARARVPPEHLRLSVLFVSIMPIDIRRSPVVICISNCIDTDGNAAANPYASFSARSFDLSINPLVALGATSAVSSADHDRLCSLIGQGRKDAVVGLMKHMISAAAQKVTSVGPTNGRRNLH